MRSLIFCFSLLLHSLSFAKEVSYLTKETLYDSAQFNNVILRKDSLFVDDFLCIHALITKFKPNSLFEIGTCTGEGTQIIKNAMPDGVVYSLDLPPGTSDYDLPVVGECCRLEYHQLYGDSSSFNYANFYPIDAWFIDGAHNYVHVLHETKEALKAASLLIIWHDADIPEVFQGIKDGLDESDDYLLYRVLSTRIAFAISKTKLHTGSQ